MHSAGVTALARTNAVTTLNRDESRPLHRQISDEIRRQISCGDLRPGDQIPSENILVSTYGVSRGTVRQALAALRAEGVLTGSRGRPLAVRGPHLTQPLSELISFSSWVDAMGKRPSGSVVEFGPRPVTDEVAAALGVTPGSLIYYLVRVRLADNQPLMVERTAFAPQVGKLLAAVDLESQSIYAELARQGVVFTSARHVISAMAASSVDARLLGVSARTPLLRILRLAFSATGVALEWSDDRYLADQVDFAIENSMSGPGVERRLA
jgi:GntR family transcriptional regulator